MLKKDIEFQWNGFYKNCLRKLKSLVCKASVLRFYNLRKAVTLTVDALSFALDAFI